MLTKRLSAKHHFLLSEVVLSDYASKSEIKTVFERLVDHRQRSLRKKFKITSCPHVCPLGRHISFPLLHTLSLTFMSKCYLIIFLLSLDDRTNEESLVVSLI